MEIKGSNFTAFFDTLTKNTSVLLIISDHGISKFLFVYLENNPNTDFIISASAATQVNIAAARKYFEKLENVDK